MLRISRTPDRWLLDLLDCVSGVAAGQSIAFFVVGAMARDVVFELAHDIEAARRTEDIDLGLRVASWDEFQRLIEALTTTGRFAKTRARQRFMFDDVIRLDVVPFGDIAQDDQIRWPPDFAIEMNVAGLMEAYSAALVVRLRDKPTLDVPFASPAGLAAMKFIAWRDRARDQRIKDAEDLAFIIRHYLDIEEVERVTRDFPQWLEGDFDYERASAELLGFDVSRLTRGRAWGRVMNVVQVALKQGLESPLLLEMSGPNASGPAVARMRDLLSAFDSGARR
ncbi:MAG: nucleotidyl transferase AbiEii/AbiGii toxin family protein [Gammaproteobacteria bacterium]